MALSQHHLFSPESPTMHLPHAALAACAVLLLAACGESESDAGADDFAARINGGAAPAAQGTVAPTVMPPRENAAVGAYSPGTATDPESATCGANAMGPFLGEPANEATRSAVVAAAGSNRNLRFVAFGSGNVVPDASSPRLNIMLDRQGIIRDARCG